MIINMPSPSDSTMVWDISENLCSESREVSTLPRGLSDGYVTKLNDVFYMIGGDTTTAYPSYKYVDGEWVEDTVLGSLCMVTNFNKDTNSNMGGVVSGGDKLYMTLYDATSSNMKYNKGVVYTYDGVTKTNATHYYGRSDLDSLYRRGSIGIAANSTGYKSIAMGQSATAAHALYEGVTGSGSTSYSVPNTSMNGAYNVKRITPYSQGVYYMGYFVYLICERTKLQTYGTTTTYENDHFRSYLLGINGSRNRIFDIELPDQTSAIKSISAIGDYIYIGYVDSGIWKWYRWSYNTLKWENVNFGNDNTVNAGGGQLVEHNGEIHRFYLNSHTAHKLYREAKTYAPKGTKIYLPYETAATSTNLQPIEGGYVVTESGNVELKIYDY